MIKSVLAREIFDSRGNPTVETQIKTEEGIFRGNAPSGASTGSAEALELRDGGIRLAGKGVRKAVSNINKIIASKIVGHDPSEQAFLDSLLLELDGTTNKRKLGGNAIVSVSIALCKAGAARKGSPAYAHIAKLAGATPRMPVPLSNLINGGKHAGLENDFQEHMVVPVKANNFENALEMVVSIFQALSNALRKRGVNPSLVADEGGFVFGNSAEERLKMLEKAAKEAGVGERVSFALDCASSEFYKKGSYWLGSKPAKKLSSKQLSIRYENLASKFKLFSIEDPFAENDWGAWSEFCSKNKKFQIVGDDLITTNPERVRMAVKMKACNSLLIKPNQVGTITETIEAANVAGKAGWSTIVSHRSGETEDPFISHLAVGLGGGQCKFGAPSRGERTAKYNELLRICEKVKKFGGV